MKRMIIGWMIVGACGIYYAYFLIFGLLHYSGYTPVVELIIVALVVLFMASPGIVLIQWGKHSRAKGVR